MWMEKKTNMDRGTENRKADKDGCGADKRYEIPSGLDRGRARDKIVASKAWQAMTHVSTKRQLIGPKRLTWLGCHLKDVGDFPTCVTVCEPWWRKQQYWLLFTESFFGYICCFYAFSSIPCLFRYKLIFIVKYILTFSSYKKITNNKKINCNKIMSLTGRISATITEF
jgi:hypothetical protein